MKIATWNVNSLRVRLQPVLAWLGWARDRVAAELGRHPRLAVAGDFNNAPGDRDVHGLAAWHEQILCSTPEREALAGLQELGLADRFRRFETEGCHIEPGPRALERPSGHPPVVAEFTLGTGTSAAPDTA